MTSTDRARRVQLVIEVETGESVNHLEALAQWAHFGKSRVPFHLYVPSGMVDVARRLCDDNHIYVSEIWSYHIVGDTPRFTMVFRNREAPPAPPRPPRPPRPRPVPRAAAPAPRKKTAPRTAKPAKKSTSRKQKRR
jgi:hypothetical protein